MMYVTDNICITIFQSPTEIIEEWTNKINQIITVDKT